MKLATLTKASMFASALGIIVLLGASGVAYERMQAKQDQIAELLTLKQEIGEFSVAADHLMLFSTGPELNGAVRAQGRSIEKHLRALSPEQPGASNAVQVVAMMLQGLPGPDAKPPAKSATAEGGYGPLGLSVSQKARLSQMANHGIALDSVMDEVLHKRQQAIAGQATRIAAGFAGVVALFGVASLGAFGYIHRRLGVPVHDLASAIARAEAGDTDARAKESGGDELAELGAAFNRMRDRQQAADAEIQAYQSDLEERTRLLEESQRMASIGSWELDLTNDHLRWSPETHRIVGVPAERFDNDPARFYDRVHSDDMETLQASRQAALSGEGPHDTTIRIVRPDGETRYVHLRAEVSFDHARQPAKLAGTIQDVTERIEREQALTEQERLLDIAGRLARFGGWSVNLATHEITWSEQVYAIHEVEPGETITVERGIAFYAPEDRDRIQELFTACASERTPFDDEFRLVTAKGNRVWVRCVGEPVSDSDGKIVRVAGAFQDITAQKQAQLEIRRLADRLRTTLESITDAFYLLDRDWQFTFINSEAERLLKRESAGLIGRNIWSEFPEAVGTRIEQEYRHAMENGVTAEFEDYYTPLEKWFDIRAYPSNEGLAVYFRDVTEQHTLFDRLRQREAELRRSQEELRTALDTRTALINALPAHICLLDEQGEVVDVNDRWRVYGQANENPDADLGVGRNYLAICDAATGDCAEEAQAAAAGLRSLLSGRRETFDLEYPCHSPQEARWFRLMARRLPHDQQDGASSRAVVMHVDITERKLGEREMQRAAYEDRLTGLYTRAGFTSALSERLRTEGDHPASMVIVLDLLALRDINEAHGHDAGDDVLKQAGARLSDAIGDNGLVARIAGDEFAVFAPVWRDLGPRDRRTAITRAFEKPFDIQTSSVNVSACFGYTRIGRDQPDPGDLIREAELAMYQTRAQAGDLWRQYTRQLDRSARARIHLTGELQDALERDEFQLHFQPKVDLASGHVLSCEALIRWNHPEQGLLWPGRFMPVAEQSQLIGPIGDWVLRDACRNVRAWRDAGLAVVRVSTNVSMVQLALGDFPDRVKRILDEEGVDPRDLTLEITESAFEDASERLQRQLTDLHRMGIRLSLDDFGTGYSSLLYLQQYPFDEIKVDKGFVQKMRDDAYSREIVETVVRVAAAVNADVVAEGVETPAERDALLDIGCRIGQGFYYSMPLEEEDFRWLLEHGADLPLTPSR